jgi:PAS domain S-box-containing protein
MTEKNNRRGRPATSQIERFRLAWEMASDAMVLSDQHGVVLAANPAYLRLYGFSADQVIGHSFAIIFPAEVRAWAVEQYPLYFAAEQVPPLVESEVERADGERRIVETTVAFLTEQGRRTAMLSIIRDVTDRKETARLRHAKQALEGEMETRRAVAQQLEHAREEERARLARDIHDALGGALTGLKIDLARLKRVPPSSAPAWAAELDGMLQVVDEAVHIMRRVASDLRPAALDDLGLASALEWQVGEFRRRSGIECRLVTAAPVDELTPDQAIAVFRIVQEALTNILRHAGATDVEVHLEQQNDRLRLRVRDDGQGIPPERLNNSVTLGLAGMHERARLLGGTLHIAAQPGQGTTLTVEIPTQS